MAAQGNGHNAGEKLRAELDHPVVDGDGHVIELRLVLLDYIKQIAGADVAKRFETDGSPPWRYHDIRGIFWGMSSGPNSLDRATAMLPRLYRERLDQAGIDIGIVYSTAVLPMMHVRDDEMRQVGHRALNTMLADMFRDVGDRLVPSAAIPMFSPDEALAELDFVVKELGMKAATFGTEVRLAVPAVAKDAPDLGKYTERVFPVALDGLYDYDPVWRRCVELKIAVACHTGARAGGGRHSSPSNFVFNHLGGFATASNYFARCLFLDGVTRRFPELNFAFLEGGVSWAAQLYNDLYEHWEKRNASFMQANLDPSKLDVDLLLEMAEKYGSDFATAEAIHQHHRGGSMGGIQSGDVEFDEFRRCEIKDGSDITDLFAKPFYFGCEADDSMNAVAFDARLHHHGARLKAFFGSDIGHWDVPDMTKCLPEAYENVEKGLFTADDFRDFVYTNPVSFFTRQNPNFFNGMSIESEVWDMVADGVAA